MPSEWAERVRRWRELTGGMDDPNEEYLAAGRRSSARGRSCRRGSSSTSRRRCARPSATRTGSSPNEAARAARASEFVARALREPGVPRRLRAVRRSASPPRASTRRSARCCCELTSPGLPDIYQGDELWSLNLVDPDNRRPVDWNARRRALADPPPKMRLIQGRARSAARAGRRRSWAATSRSTPAQMSARSARRRARCSSPSRLRGPVAKPAVTVPWRAGATVLGATVRAELGDLLERA